jgi:hypothetical protein
MFAGATESARFAQAVVSNNAARRKVYFIENPLVIGAIFEFMNAK